MSKIINKENINKTVRYLKKNGVSSAFYAAKERTRQKRSDTYTYIDPTDEELSSQKTFVSDSGMRGETENAIKWPFITVVMPAYETNPQYLKEAIESVLAQSYPYYELVITDASTSDAVSSAAEEYISRNPERVKYIRLEYNGGISQNTNQAIDAARGEYIALLDHDDMLTPDALFHIAGTITEHPNAAIVYSDEDKTDEEAKNYFDVHEKLDFNYDLLLSNNYICHLMTIKTDILRNISLRSKYDGAQDYDLVLQVVRLLINDKGLGYTQLSDSIVHIPRVLYHWRCHSNSTAGNTNSKQYAYESGLRAIYDHIQETTSKDAGYVHLAHSKHLGFYDVDWSGDTLVYVSAHKEAESIFKFRPEVGAVVGRVLDGRGCMRGYLLNENGECLYKGISRHYAGKFNRFDCAQNVYAADIRYMTYRDETRALLKKFLKEKGITREDYRNGINMKNLSMEFCKLLHEEGYLIVYLPIMNR